MTVGVSITPAYWAWESTHFAMGFLAELEKERAIPPGTPVSKVIPGLTQDPNQSLRWTAQNGRILDRRSLAFLLALGTPVLERKPSGLPWSKLEEILASDRNGGWTEHFLRMRENLEESGFLRKGLVRRLITAEEGIAFVDRIAASLPCHRDILDALALLDFGSTWDKRGINAALQRLGRSQEEWDGSKAGALLDLTCNEAQVFVGLTASLKRKPMPRQEIPDSGPLDSPHRLQVLSRVLGHYASRPEWTDRLNSTSRGHSMPHSYYQELNRRVDEVIREFLELFAPGS